MANISASLSKFESNEELNLTLETLDQSIGVKDSICEALEREERGEVTFKYFTKSMLTFLCREISNDDISVQNCPFLSKITESLKSLQFEDIIHKPELLDNIFSEIFYNLFNNYPEQANRFFQTHMVSFYPILRNVNISIDFKGGINEGFDSLVLNVFFKFLIKILGPDYNPNNELKFKQLLNAARYSTSENDLELKYHIGFLKTLQLKNFQKKCILCVLEKHKSVASYIKDLASLQYEFDPESGNDTLALFYPYPFQVANHKSYEEFIRFCTNIELSFPEMRNILGHNEFLHTFDEEISKHRHVLLTCPTLHQMAENMLFFANSPKLRTGFLMCSPFFNYAFITNFDENIYRSAAYMTNKFLQDLYPRDAVPKTPLLNVEFKLNDKLFEKLIKSQHTGTIDFALSSVKLESKAINKFANLAIKNFAYASLRILKRRITETFVLNLECYASCTIVCAMYNYEMFAEYLLKLIPPPKPLIFAIVQAAIHFRNINFLKMIIESDLITDYHILSKALKEAMAIQSREMVQLIYEYYPTVSDLILSFFWDENFIITETSIDFALMKPNLNENWVVYLESSLQNNQLENTNLLAYLKSRRPGIFGQNKRRRLE